MNHDKLFQLGMALIGLLSYAFWPLLIYWFIKRFDRELRALLSELPSVVRRLLSMKALGAELTLDALERDLPRAEMEAKRIDLPTKTTGPELNLPAEVDNDAA